MPNFKNDTQNNIQSSKDIALDGAPLKVTEAWVLYIRPYKVPFAFLTFFTVPACSA